MHDPIASPALQEAAHNRTGKKPGIVPLAVTADAACRHASDTGRLQKMRVKSAVDDAMELKPDSSSSLANPARLRSFSVGSPGVSKSTALQFT